MSYDIDIAKECGQHVLKLIFLGFIGISFVLLHPATGRAAKITDVRFWTAPDHTRVVLDLTEPLPARECIPGESSQFHLELKEVSLQTKTRELEVNDPFVKKFTLTDLGKREESNWSLIRRSL